MRIEEPPFAKCQDCGGQLGIIIWEDKDAAVSCTECDNKELYL